MKSSKSELGLSFPSEKGFGYLLRTVDGKQYVVLDWIVSLRADKIKPWLTPSVKQRQNPCSSLPAVYPDLSTCHDWPAKKGLCFVCRDRQSG